MNAIPDQSTPYPLANGSRHRSLLQLSRLLQSSSSRRLSSSSPRTLSPPPLFLNTISVISFTTVRLQRFVPQVVSSESGQTKFGDFCSGLLFRLLFTLKVAITDVLKLLHSHYGGRKGTRDRELVSGTTLRGRSWTLNSIPHDLLVEVPLCELGRALAD
jgi:hypothetical protein